MVLRDKNISLRRLEDEDIEPMARIANNKKIADNLRDIFPFPYTEQHAIAFIDGTGREAPPVTFAIEYDGQFCGVVGLVLQTDVYRKSAEIGYWLGEPFWNKGIASIAVKLITPYAFKTLNLSRIHAGVFAYNLPSMRVLEKNSFLKEGIFERAIFKNGQLWDEHRYAKVNG